MGGTPPNNSFGVTFSGVANGTYRVIVKTEAGIKAGESAPVTVAC